MPELIIDGRAVAKDSTVEVDLCIIGAGPAGNTIAGKFLNSRTSVALVESGGLEWNEATQELAEGEVRGPGYFPIKETRIRAFGGSTRQWAGVCASLSPLDFASRSWVKNSGWPISDQDIGPHYQNALSVITIAETLEAGESEVDGSGAVQWSDVNFAERAWVGKKRLPEFRSASNVKVLLNSSVVELEIDADRTRITSVLLACIGGNRFRVKARRYVLAAGGIENPRILLASNRVAREGIGNNHDLVGRYFMEHPRVTERFRLPVGTKALASRVTGVAGTLRFSRLQLSESVQRQERLLNFQASLAFGYAGQHSDQWDAVRRIGYSILRPWRDFPYYLDKVGGRNKTRWEDIKTVLKRPDRSIPCVLGFGVQLPALRRWLQIESTVEQPPLPHNRVVLGTKTDQFGTAVPKLIWSLSDDEEHSYKRGLELVLQKLETLEPGISDARMDDPEPWPAEVIGTWHHMGTTRMHQDPKQGVVDPNCRVHGIDNLYIAGSSVFTTSGVHSPTLTIVALALRLADYLERNV